MLHLKMRRTTLEMKGIKRKCPKASYGSLSSFAWCCMHPGRRCARGKAAVGRYRDVNDLFTVTCIDYSAG